MNATKKEILNIACTVYNLMIGIYDKETVVTPYNHFVEDEFYALLSMYEKYNMLETQFDCEYTANGINLSEGFINAIFDILQDICISAFILSYTKRKITDEKIIEMLKLKIKKNKDLKSALHTLHIVAEGFNGKSLVDEIEDTILFIYDQLMRKMIYYGRKFSGKNDLVWLNSFDLNLAIVEKRVKKFISLKDIV